jgi:hypothetical protein
MMFWRLLELDGERLTWADLRFGAVAGLILLLIVGIWAAVGR